VKLLIATRSEGKQREARRLLEAAGVEPVFPDDLGLSEAPQEAALELGDSFAANARAKAEYFARRTGLPTVADDSGLEVLSLGGAPGVRSKRFAAVSDRVTGAALDAANNAELLRRLEGAPPPRRRARYRCVLAYYSSASDAPELFDESCGGTILDYPRGKAGFGYDPLFLSDDLGKTFAEADPDEKDRVSHRGRAFRLLLGHLAPAHQLNSTPSSP
jgi:XTP/dITP diphosphohydrolase